MYRFMLYLVTYFRLIAMNIANSPPKPPLRLTHFIGNPLAINLDTSIE